MKDELLEKLLDAGFTKDEIIQLARDEPIKEVDSENGPETQDNGNPKPDDEGKPDIENKPDGESKARTENKSSTQDEPDHNPEANFENRLSGIEKGISDLVKAIQIQNLKKDSFNASPDSLDDQTDKIMRSIIRPETEKKG